MYTNVLVNFFKRLSSTMNKKNVLLMLNLWRLLLWFWLWFINQQDSLTNMLLMRWRCLILKFRLKII